MVSCTVGIDCILKMTFLVVWTIVTSPAGIITGALILGGIIVLRAPRGRWRK